MNSLTNHKTKKCPKCKMEIDKKATVCPHCRSKQGISCSGALAFVIIAIFIIGIANNNSTQSSQSSQSGIPAQTTAYIPSREEYIEMCETIDYETLSRNPDKYKGKDFCIKGEVIQVVESESEKVDLRINITKGDYFWSDTIYATVTIPAGADRILEDDIITIYGKCEGLYSYESVRGAKISLPLITVYYYSTENE